MRQPFAAEFLENRLLLSATSPIDPSFGVVGVVAGIGGPIKMLLDGKILVDVNDSGTIRRLNPDGSPDPTFNPSGVIDDWKPGVARDPQGRLLVLNNGVIARYNRDGSLDSSFGNAGHVSSFYLNSQYASFTAEDIAVQGSKIVVGGEVASPPQPVSAGGMQLAVERLNSDGSPDSKFGIHTAGYGYLAQRTVRVKVAPDGVIFLAGQVLLATDVPTPEVARFAPNGPDNSTGKLVTAAGNLVGDLAFAPGGKLLLAGEYDQYKQGQTVITSRQAFVGRLNLRLVQDYPFGGQFSGDLVVPTDSAGAGLGEFVAAQADRRILLSILHPDGTRSLVRLLPHTYQDATGTITGHVFNDVNGDGIQEPGEPPLSGWRVYVDLKMSGVWEPGDPTAITDANGNFAIAPLTANQASDGPYGFQVREIPQQGWYQTNPSLNSPNAGAVILNYYPKSGGSAQAVFGNTRIQNIATVSGHVGTTEFGEANWVVFLDLNHDGVQEPNEPSAMTDDNGNYTITGVPPGTYDLRDVVHDGWRQVSPPASGTMPDGTGGTGLLRVTLPGARTVHVNFHEHRVSVSRVVGTVFNDLNQNGRLQPGDAGLAGFSVELGDTPYHFVASTYTDGNGHFVFEDVPEGNYLLSVFIEPHVPWLPTYPGNGVAVRFGRAAIVSGLALGVSFDASLEGE